MEGAIAWCAAPIKNVYPSGFDLAAIFAPRVPPAPPRLSIIICLPRFFVHCADKGLAIASVPPPAGNGTIIVMGLEGQLSAIDIMAKQLNNM